MRARLEIINGLRGFAILAVLWHHLFGSYFKTDGTGALTPPLMGGFFLSYGWIGVHLFFLLSGFVLYLPYAQGRAAQRTPADALTFYRHRAARLLPLYYFSALICLVLNQTPPTGGKLGAELLSIGLVLFPFVNHGFEPWLNPPLWSLGIEIWFSFLFPFAIMSLRGLGAGRFLVLAGAIGCVSRAAGLAANSLPLSTGLTATLEVFGAGMVLAQWYVDSAGRQRRLGQPRLVAATGILVLVVSILAKQTGSPVAAILLIDGITLGLALVTAGLLSLRGGLLYATFANRPIQLIGMLCYSVYIWHQPILRHIFGADVAPLDGLAETLPVYLVLLAAIGALSYRFIEFGKVANWRLLLPSSPERAPARYPVAAIKPRSEPL
jgi:peptidoglycan/LPS O-acetylase OafA/YrhL